MQTDFLSGFRTSQYCPSPPTECIGTGQLPLSRIPDGGDISLNKFYIAKNEQSYHHFVLHFGHCLRRQEDMENKWNANHLLAERIGLTKRTPLPFYKSGTHKSVQIDQKGLYYILRSYIRAGGDLIHECRHKYWNQQ